MYHRKSGPKRGILCGSPTYSRGDQANPPLRPPPAPASLPLDDTDFPCTGYEHGQLVRFRFPIEDAGCVVTEEAKRMLSRAKELCYLTSIVMRLFEDTGKVGQCMFVFPLFFILYWCIQYGISFSLVVHIKKKIQERVQG